MSGRESGHGPSASVDPDSLELAPGTAHEKLEGSVPSLANEEDLRKALEQAFDYRGDVLITRKDGAKVEGYIFDRTSGTRLADSFVRLLPKDGSPRIKLSYAEIAALAFTGRDMAAGKSWGKLGEALLGKKGGRREGYFAAAGEAGIAAVST